MMGSGSDSSANSTASPSSGAGFAFGYGIATHPSVHPSGGRELDAQREYVDAGFDLGEGGQRRRDADVPILGIMSMRERRACRRQGNTQLTGQGDDGLREPGQRIERDEIAALRIGPGREAGSTQAPFQSALHGLELGPHDLRMTAHVRL